MAEAFEKRFTGWVAAVLGSLLAAGGGGIFWMAMQQATMTQQISSLIDTVSELKVNLATSTADRYTGTSAASDRAAFLSAFTSAIDSVSRSNATVVDGVSDRVQAISIRQTEFDRTLKDLVEFKVRTEERLKLEGKQP